MYLVYDTLRLLTKDAEKAKNVFPNGGDKALKAYQSACSKRAPGRSHLGQDHRRNRAWAWDDGRLEADRHHGRRADRQDPSHLRHGRRRRADGGEHDPARPV